MTDRGRLLEFSFEDILRYHGGGSPGGAAHAFKVLERALPLLDPDALCERREIVVDTAFGGPGARDAFEMVIRAVPRIGSKSTLPSPVRSVAWRWSGRVSPDLPRSQRDPRATRGLRDRRVRRLARTENRTPEEEQRLDLLKQQMADRVMAHPADEVYAPAVD